MSENRCGVFALLGEPNAGKSTLMNRIAGTRISVVTHKAQTTRFCVRGIRTKDDTQLVLVDTPGLFRARRLPDRAMVQEAWSAVSDSDAILLVVDARKGVSDGLRMIVRGIAERVESLKAHVQETSRETTIPVAALVLNKIDLVKKPRLLELSAELNGLSEFDATFMISARSGSGVDHLATWLESASPVRPWQFPEDRSSDLTPEQFAAEVTRKHALLHLHQELPYELVVEPVSWETMQNGSVRIEQEICVKRPGHRGIILGGRGQTIRAIGASARSELSELLEVDAHLFLQVRVRPRQGGGASTRPRAGQGQMN